MEKDKLYECTVSMSYNASDPADAANQLIENIRTNPGWYVKVKEIDPSGNFYTGHYTVDTATGEIEEE